MKNRPAIIAHRGASGQAPENTLAAIRLAWKIGADAVELDLRLTSDGEVVLIHDGTTERTTGVNLEVAAAPLCELKKLDAGSFKGERWKGEPIPTFREVLQELPDGKWLAIEIKETRAILEPLGKLLKESAIAPGRLLLMGFDQDLVAEVKRLWPEHPAILISSTHRKRPEAEWPEVTRSLIAAVRENRLDGLSLGTHAPFSREAFLPELEAFREAGIPLYYWTHNDPEHAGWFVEKGTRGIVTDVPEQFLASIPR